MSPGNTQQSEMRYGVVYALGAFLLWGFSPLYYRATGEAPALEILAHRVIWSLLFTLAVVLLYRRGGEFFQLLRRPRLMGVLVASSLLVSINWLVFIWSVNNGRALQASLGYFLLPIVMVILGRIFLGERLSRPQLLSVLLACAAVINLLLRLDTLPWVPFVLASSFGLYGMVRKMTPIDALMGLTVECLLLTPVALLYLFWQEEQGLLVFGHRGWGLDLLLMGTALMTALPLLLFTTATRILRLGTVGMLQYINPSCQFLVALLLFGEPFGQVQQVTFGLIWLALAIYTIDSQRQLRVARH